MTLTTSNCVCCLPKLWLNTEDMKHQVSPAKEIHVGREARLQKTLTCRNAKKGEGVIGWRDVILCFGMNLKGLMFLLAVYLTFIKSILPSQC